MEHGRAGLRKRLLARLAALELDVDCEWTDHTSLIKSGRLDSLILFNLAMWIEEEIGVPIDLGVFDLLTEWDTPHEILSFIERHRTNDGAGEP